MKRFAIILLIIFLVGIAGCKEEDKKVSLLLPSVVKPYREQFCMMNRLDPSCQFSPYRINRANQYSSSTENFSSNMTMNQRLADVKTLTSILDHQYAPKQWKESLFNFSFVDAVDRLIESVSVDSMDDRDFYAMMRRFVCSFNDGHLGIHAPTTYSAKLGFEVDRFGDDVLIVEIDDRLLPGNRFPFSVGDKLIAIDNIPVERIEDQILPYICSGNMEQRKRLAAAQLTNRNETILLDMIPSEDDREVRVTIYSQERKREETISLDWIDQGYRLARGNNFGALKASRSSQIDVSEKAVDPLKQVRTFRYRDARFYSRYDRVWPLFPLWDSFVERRKEPVVTGMFKAGNFNFGFMRIHTWMFSPADEEELIKVFDEETRFFEQNADALVIDQTYNGGGNGCLVFEAISRLIKSGEVFPEMTEKVMASRKSLGSFEGMAMSCDFEKEGEDCKVLERIVSQIREAMLKGEQLAGPFPACNFSGLVKSKGNFTKPILVLINEMSISCGDVFPIMMKEIGRAKLFGYQTAGGGGGIEGIFNLGYSDFSLFNTMSLLVREKPVGVSSNGDSIYYVENYGARPDYEYKETAKDYLNEYKDYRSAIEKALLEIVHK